MKKYWSFFRLRFMMGLQYRTAAFAGMTTQFFWGFMQILIFKAFYEADASAFPMTFQATVSYVWLKQAFLAFFGAWFMENEMFESIANGNIAYELCRPIRIYDMWFARNLAYRAARATLRCFPILVVALFMPAPYGLALPASVGQFIFFLISLVLAVLVMVAFGMIVCMLTFFTVSPQGIRMIFISTMEFLTGDIIPLPFLTEPWRTVLELLPFGAMENVALRVYSGDLTGETMVRGIGLQVFWLIVLVAGGRLLGRIAEKKVRLQGG